MPSLHTLLAFDIFLFSLLLLCETVTVNMNTISTDVTTLKKYGYLLNISKGFYSTCTGELVYINSKILVPQ